MSLLNGGLSRIFAKAFAGIYLPATLTRVVLVDDGEGGYTTTTQEYACRAQVDNTTEAMRTAPGYTESDRRILVLEDTLGDGLVPSTDDEITVGGQRYGIQSVSSDPALSHWELRGARI